MFTILHKPVYMLNGFFYVLQFYSIKKINNMKFSTLKPHLIVLATVVVGVVIALMLVKFKADKDGALKASLGFGKKKVATVPAG